MMTLVGLLVLFAWALAVLVAVMTAAMVRMFTRPRRSTVGVMMAKGLATDPVETVGRFAAFEEPREAP